jgi:hypothetical protein
MKPEHHLFFSPFHLDLVSAFLERARGAQGLWVLERR